MKKLILLLLTCAAFSANAQKQLPDPEAYFMSFIVEDIDTSLKWYKGILGFDIINEMASEQGGYNIAILKRGNVLLEVMELKDALAPKKELAQVDGKLYLQGIFKVGFQLEDFDDWVDYLKKEEVEFHGTVVKDENLGIRTVIIKDPDGNYIQLFEK
ncbi:VOC family protein [Fulvivirga lutimaris]|uniref:VOC family protein n=1 Tax=Fulvivirga lutimaris TaxID=1819566 RepID=UPI0012BBD6CA|nr:VOC family protein [Fulvivirga lutimaris]MTI41860.1 VOC family protein [Fulvivirga lutimaris]